MCDQQILRPACAYAQSDQSLCQSLRYFETVKLLTEHNLDLLSLKEGCTGSSESTLVKMPHCWKSRVTAHIASEKLARDRGLLVLQYSMVIITFTQRVLVLGNLSEL